MPGDCQPGASLVADAIASGALWRGRRGGRSSLHAAQGPEFSSLAWLMACHSHIDHLKAMVVQAGGRSDRLIHAPLMVAMCRAGALDVVPHKAFLAEISGADFDVRIASGGGRHNITMDRYDANWSMVERGWKTHVLGEGQQFANATAAVPDLATRSGTIDQDLPPFIIGENGKPVGTIEDGDSVVFFNFRGDQHIEISRAFEEAVFDKFDRVGCRK
ncbi:MAG: hypothetical protein U5M23_08530 [Marinagarivorans sp.]|nr:hypothetical protein [Marinagarivorans sp.]